MASRRKLFEIGYQDVMNYFKSFLPLKKRFLLEKYKSMFIWLKEFDLGVRSGFVGKSKTSLGELFIELADSRDNIDEKIYIECIDLKNIFKSSLRQGLLGERISEPQKINKISGCILEMVSKKIQELENYVDK